MTEFYANWWRRFEKKSSLVCRSMADDRRLLKLNRHLSDIVSYGQSVIDKLADISLERFNGDIDLLHLVAYRLQCVSEATKNTRFGAWNRRAISGDSMDASLSDRQPRPPRVRRRQSGRHLGSSARQRRAFAHQCSESGTASERKSKAVAS